MGLGFESQPDHRRNKQDAPDLKVGRFLCRKGIPEACFRNVLAVQKIRAKPGTSCAPGVCKIARGAECLIETYTNYAIYRLKTFTACLLSRYSHTLLYDSILHGIIG